MPNGDKYEGGWFKNYHYEKGKYTYLNEVSKETNKAYNDKFKNGYFVFIYPDNSKYEGNFLNN